MATKISYSGAAQALMNGLRDDLNERLKAVAEPIVQKHLKAANDELNQAMREELSSCLVGLCKRWIKFDTMEDRIVITVKNMEEKH